jgi:cyclopropane-fatty-acyl-phospholipid synthase
MNNYESSPIYKKKPNPNWLENFLIKKLNALLNKGCGTLSIKFPSGFECQFGTNQPKADIQLNSFKPLMRLYFGGTNGWSESYLAKEWDSSNLTALIKWSLAHEKSLETISKASFLTQFLDNIYHRKNDNSRQGSKRNIAAHYDLGNNFYRLWLDESMTYSAALYDHPTQPLAQAQHNKYARILELLDAKAGQNIAEIGCGWGGFAIQAAKEKGLNVEGITLSQEQLKWAKQQVINNNVDQQVDLRLKDYRDINQQYDAIVSIEMFEAVGEAHWDTYFKTLKQALKPEGNAVLQIITIDDERFHSYRKQADFIQRYVFPGGMLPSVEKLNEKFVEHGLKLKHQQLFGKDYAKTLQEWSKAFEQNWQQLSTQGFDENFYRLWRYYLAYCQGGFEQGSIDVGLFVLGHADAGDQ